MKPLPPIGRLSDQPVDWNALPQTRPRRRSFVPLPVGARLPAITQGASRKSGFQDAFILTHWRDVVGAELATVSAPERVSRPRAKQDGSTPPATLTIRVDGPSAIEFTHLEPQILDRINRQYGYRAIGRLKLVQGPLPRRGERRKALLQPALSEEERAKLDQLLEGGPGGELQQALAALGAKVLASRRASQP